MMAKPSKFCPTPEQPLRGKYDGRKNNRFKIPHRKGINSKRKPEWLKDLGVKHAIDILEEFDKIVPPAELYTQAYEKHDLALCWDMRKHVECRVLGKPFVAVNPELQPKPASVLNEDNRLQLAVNTLIVQGPMKGIRKGLAGDPLLIEGSSALSTDTAQTYEFTGFDEVDG